MIAFKERIMIVDDTPENLKLLSRMLEGRGYRVFAFTKGESALWAAEKHPPDLILLDIKMPELDGYEVCQQLKANKKLAEIPVIFISALAGASDKIKAFQVGGVDYITKPFQIDEINARVETHLKIRELQIAYELQNKNLQLLVAEQVKEISESQMSIIFALAKLAEYRDIDTGNHLERVQEFCRVLTTRLHQASPYAKFIDEKFIANIYYASPLHDIGKVVIPDDILLKPGKLTAEEFEIMKTHATVGAEYLETVLEQYTKNDFLRIGVEIAQSSHERWDGKGYPQGLRGENIPLSARIMALVDVYDAVRSRRCYKSSVNHETACSIIAAESNAHFDPVITETFMQIKDEFNNIYTKVTSN